MGDPVTALAIGSTVAATGLKVAGNQADAASKKSAAQIDAAKLKTEASAAEARGSQINAAYEGDLSASLQAMDAIRTSQNVSIDSPTALALDARAEEISGRARRTAVSNEKLKAMGLSADSQNLLRSSRAYSTAALLRSAGDIASAGQAVAGAFRSSSSGAASADQTYWV